MKPLEWVCRSVFTLALNCCCFYRRGSVLWSNYLLMCKSVAQAKTSPSTSNVSVFVPDSRVVTGLSLNYRIPVEADHFFYSYTIFSSKYKYGNIVHLTRIYWFPQKGISAAMFCSYELLLPLDD